MSSDSEKPDFDSMSPYELMKWMESLQKEQKADVTSPRFTFSKLPSWLARLLGGGKTSSSHVIQDVDE